MECVLNIVLKDQRNVDKEEDNDMRTSTYNAAGSILR